MKKLAFLLAFTLASARTFAAGDTPPSTDQNLLFDIFRELVEINTTHSSGSTTRAAEAMAKRLRAAGFSDGEVKLMGPDPQKGNLVARMRGTGAQKPLLLLAHLDVVEARREDWSMDPFKLVEKDGFYYGRGTTDDKAMAAIWIANLIRLKKAGAKPNRDLILALTADEEGGFENNGVRWLLAKHRNLIDAELCINEGGGGEIKKGRYLMHAVQTSEKLFASFVLETTNKGGHSSLPVKDNAIYRLAAGLARLAAYEFPVRLNDTTRGYFDKMAVLETGANAIDMKAMARSPIDAAVSSRLANQSAVWNAQMRTTCVATRLEGGHAENALPQMARATVNCRLLPNDSADDVRRTLIKIMADPQIKVQSISPDTAGPASPLRPDLIKTIEEITLAMWPGVVVIPRMSSGATDGRFLRAAGIPTYGVSGIFSDMDDVRAHGRDERIGKKQLYEGQEFLYRLVNRLAGINVGSPAK